MARNVDYRFASFRLVPGTDRFGPRSLEINRSVTAAELELTIEGASTLTVTLEDEPREILRSRTLTRWAWGEDELDEDSWILRGRAITVELDDLAFRLVKVAKSGPALTLTFEDRSVAWLKLRTGARKAKRGKVTRAEFVQMLVDEVKPKGAIPTVIPELRKEQEIAQPDVPRLTRDVRREEARPGINTGPGGSIGRGVRLTVKGARATSEQVRNAEASLDIAVRHRAPALAMVALIAAEIVESTIRNLPGGDRDSIGILQARVGIHGRLDFAQQITKFLTDGFTGAGGAISIARANPQLTPGQIAQRVQGSAFPERYDQFRSEAEAFVRAYAGGRLDGLAARGARTELTTEYAVLQPFFFERKEHENSWNAIERLAEEVAWRRFMRKGKLYYMSDEDLFAQRVDMRIREQQGGVDVIDCDVDIGVKTKRLGATARVTARADRWTALPGMVVELEEMGPVDGRWLVRSVRKPDLFDEAVEIELAKPLPEKLEPAPEVEVASQTVTIPGRPGGTSVGSQRDTQGLSGRQLLRALAHIAQDEFGLNVLDYGPSPGRAYPGFGADAVVTGNHVTGSRHFTGRAFDASNGVDTPEEQAFAALCRARVGSIPGPSGFEIYWCGPGAVNSQNGQPTSCGGGTGGHRDHVHVGYMGA